jgi:hypothetical protein
VHHSTVITWVKCLGQLLPDAYEPETVPLLGELDELETFVGSKKTCIWLWRAVMESAETFRPSWAIVQPWHCYEGSH